MDEQFGTILSIAVIPQTVSLIADRKKMTEQKALEDFYRSKTYKYLSDEKTKLWHYSPMTIFSIWEHEISTGKVAFPEEV